MLSTYQLGDRDHLRDKKRQLQKHLKRSSSITQYQWFNKQTFIPVFMYELRSCGSFWRTNCKAYFWVSELDELRAARPNATSCTLVNFRTRLSWVNKWTEGRRLWQTRHNKFTLLENNSSPQVDQLNIHKAALSYNDKYTSTWCHSCTHYYMRSDSANSLHAKNG